MRPFQGSEGQIKTTERLTSECGASGCCIFTGNWKVIIGHVLVITRQAVVITRHVLAITVHVLDITRHVKVITRHVLVIPRQMVVKSRQVVVITRHLVIGLIVNFNSQSEYECPGHVASIGQSECTDPDWQKLAHNVWGSVKGRGSYA